MIQGNWKCGTCNAEITELPFEPSPERMNQLLCRDCHRKKLETGGGGLKQTHQGNWECSGCKTSITSLPFEPDAGRLDQLLCLNCWKQRRSQ